MNISAKKILLFDGLGALITFILLSQVLARFEGLFGMPKEVLFLLSIVALCFAIFSISSYLFLKNNIEKHIKIILIANTTYGISTLVLVGIHIQKLTGLGIAYFVGEIIIILLLVYTEYRIVKHARTSF